MKILEILLHPYFVALIISAALILSIYILLRKRIERDLYQVEDFNVDHIHFSKFAGFAVDLTTHSIAYWWWFKVLHVPHAMLRRYDYLAVPEAKSTLNPLVSIHRIEISTHWESKPKIKFEFWDADAAESAEVSVNKVISAIHFPSAVSADHIKEIDEECVGITSNPSIGTGLEKQTSDRDLSNEEVIENFDCQKPTSSQDRIERLSKKLQIKESVDTALIGELINLLIEKGFEKGIPAQLPRKERTLEFNKAAKILKAGFKTKSEKVPGSTYKIDESGGAHEIMTKALCPFFEKNETHSGLTEGTIRGYLSTAKK